jgi:hypothetical protein
VRVHNLDCRNTKSNKRSVSITDIDLKLITQIDIDYSAANPS